MLPDDEDLSINISFSRMSVAAGPPAHPTSSLSPTTTSATAVLVPLATANGESTLVPLVPRSSRQGQGIVVNVRSQPTAPQTEQYTLHPPSPLQQPAPSVTRRSRAPPSTSLPARAPGGPPAGVSVPRTAATSTPANTPRRRHGRRSAMHTVPDVQEPLQGQAAAANVGTRNSNTPAVNEVRHVQIDLTDDSSDDQNSDHVWRGFFDDDDARTDSDFAEDNS